MESLSAINKNGLLEEIKEPELIPEGRIADEFSIPTEKSLLQISVYFYNGSQNYTLSMGPTLA